MNAARQPTLLPDFINLTKIQKLELVTAFAIHPEKRLKTLFLVYFSIKLDYPGKKCYLSNYTLKSD